MAPPGAKITRKGADTAIAFAVLQGLVALVALFALYLLVVAILPDLTVPPQPLERANTPAGPADSSPPFSTDRQFEANGSSVSGWLYRPEPSA
ncbi:MAG: hypothetical protein ABIF09_10690, partial [Gemmatimonadota bacterium]